jgi:hypothetical protein
MCPRHDPPGVCPRRTIPGRDRRLRSVGQEGIWVHANENASSGRHASAPSGHVRTTKTADESERKPARGRTSPDRPERGLADPSATGTPIRGRPPCESTTGRRRPPPRNPGCSIWASCRRRHGRPQPAAILARGVQRTAPRRIGLPGMHGYQAVPGPTGLNGAWAIDASDAGASPRASHRRTRVVSMWRQARTRPGTGRSLGSGRGRPRCNGRGGAPPWPLHGRSPRYASWVTTDLVSR